MMARVCTDCFNCVTPIAGIWVADRRRNDRGLKLRTNAHLVGPVRCKKDKWARGPYHSVYALEVSPSNEVLARGCSDYENET